MRRGFTLIQLLVIVAVIGIFTVLCAFAEKTGGEYGSDRVGGVYRFSTDLAPVSQQVTKVTKGYYNLPLSNFTQFKFWFTKTADDTTATAICKVRVGGYTSTSNVGLPTTGERLHVGKGQKYMGFTCASTAGTNINFLLQ